MAKKYTVYKLKNVKGKKNEYVLDDSQRLKYICKSLSEGYRELQEYWDDCLDGPVWYNSKIDEFVAYEKDDRMLYVPNDKMVRRADGDCEIRRGGIYNRLPIYYLDIYPNPYLYYKLHKTEYGFELEAITEYTKDE
ncbi:MAG: hypothetical protein IKV77_09515 [Alistipes sp.]|nr:hypothetical protein [Alistipes sp.]